MANFISENDEGWDEFNEYVFQKYRSKDWQDIYKDWKENYLTFLSLSEKVSEDAYLVPGLFHWMDGQQLLDVLYGSAFHHADHWRNIERFFLPHHEARADE